MPEIKNTFLQGKMNKDLDERLVPNGQYRHANNVEISTSEDSDIGVVKNILGNHRLDDIIDSQQMTCVASIGHEKANKLYWFVTSYTKDAIFEYDVSNDIVLPVLVDMYAGTSKAVLKFSGNIITGINIIDNLLFWTDNNSEPKKINIDICKKGTNVNGNEHTKLIFENGSFDAFTITSIFPDNPNEEIEKLTGRYFYFSADKFLKTINTWEHIASDSSNETVMRTRVRHYRDNKFLGSYNINFFNTVNEPNPNPNNIYVENSSNPGLIPFESGGYPGNGTMARRRYAQSSDTDWRIGDVIFGDGITLDIQEQHITVIKQKPLSALSVKINHSDSSNNKYSVPNLFETKFPRFSYRYKFEDGEFSAFAPFTQPVFNPKYTKDNSVSSETPVFYNKDNSYDIKEPHNKAMVNSIHSVELTNFIDPNTPENVKEIEILYKQEESSVIYSIGTIKNTNYQWHIVNNNENSNINMSVTPNTRWGSAGGLTCGKYLVTTENIYAALPANQLLRPWDNVPKKALAQEVTGSRIVYGNYVQNYDLTNEVNVTVSYDTKKNSFSSFDTQGLPSIKSQRNYQMGVVYCDKYGRETPVFTSRGASVYVPWQEKDGVKNASKSLQLNVSTAANFPEWVDSLKFFVKETSNEYYNLVMDRAWVTKSTYELDDSEGHLWLSFPSSDRNKISEEDYIILKKKIGPNEKQVDLENKFKVINVSNEAPDAIKYQLVNLGSFSNTSADILTTGADKLFSASGKRPDSSTTNALVDTIEIQKVAWKRKGDTFNSALEPVGSNIDANNVDQPIGVQDLYVSWKRETSGNNISSKKYKVVGGFISANTYILKLSTPITKADSDIAHAVGNSDVAGGLHEDLIFQVEKRILKDAEDFSGKFFVKISKNEVSGIIETGNLVNILDQFQVKAKASSWYWQDKAGTKLSTNDNNFGNTNYNGFDVGNSQVTDANNGIHSINNNVVGNVELASLADTSSSLKVTDYAEAWEGIETKFGPTFFVDSMHMAAGQSQASNYAKYCCITWAGCTKDDNVTAKESAWSYPPLKQWISDFGDTSNLVQKQPTSNTTIASSFFAAQYQNIYYDNNLLSTAPGLPQNSDYEDMRVDGWVGPLQNVSRDLIPDGTGHLNDNHINGLEGFVTTSLVHSKGPRRWFSGITGGKTEYGVGSETNTYADNDQDIDRHFMHLSFFAPGKDLHDGNWNIDSADSVKMIYGDRAFMANLQGIWGGGVFTGENRDEFFGLGATNADKFTHFPMEGNYDSSLNYLPETPGPGIGYGYNLKYRELHERQWDPTFNENGDPDNKIRDFIRNLHAGAKFRFNRTKTPGSDVEELIDNTVYTIKKVHVKKLYNHTSWRRPYNRYFGTYAAGSTHPYESDSISEQFQSVEEVAMRWLATAEEGDNGGDALSGINGPNGFGTSGLIKKIEDFGAAHNRRLCYIIELDKNPAFSNSDLGNPVQSNVVLANGNSAPNDSMNADSQNDNFTDIEFLDPVEDLFLSDLSKFPAIWELDPKKQEVDLDIYYEASSNIPVKINSQTNELFAPVGCKVEIINSQNTGSSILQYWDKQTVVLDPGFAKADTSGEIDYTGVSLKFIRKDGSYTIAEAGLQDLDGGTTGFKTDFVLRENIADVISAGLSWHNCFSFGNGIESNRIRDDFNQPFLTNGVKASTITQETYKQERRKNGLIYSGIYNSNSGVNDLNQFIMAEKITKDLNPTYGSIQKLFSRNSDLVSFCEDKVVKILANKDALFNADGNTNLTATENVLGQSIPFIGEYGIATNPESFASESYRAYFTDKQRGAVLRLSRDGLTPISEAGMNDFFRDNLREYNNLIGTYDDYKNSYNLTLSNNPSFNENILLDSFLGIGEELEDITIGSSNKITNPVPTGVSLQYLYEPTGAPTHNVLEYENSNNFFDWSPFDYNAYNLTSSVIVVHHAEIPAGSLQNAIAAQSQTTTQVSTGFIDVQTGTTAIIPFQEATYSTSLSDNGNFWSPDFGSYQYDVFGSSSTAPYQVDPDIWCATRRYQYGTYIGITDTISAFNQNYNQSYWPYGYDPTTEKTIFYSTNSGSYLNTTFQNRISTCITRDKDTGYVMFDRVQDNTSYIENMALTGSPPPPGVAPYLNLANNVGLLNSEYYGNLAGSGPLTGYYNNGHHNEIYNGDEIHVTVELICYPTYATQPELGYNYIAPKIQLFDGSTAVSSNYIVDFPGYPDTYLQSGQATQNNYEYIQSLNPVPALPGLSTNSISLYVESSTADHHEYYTSPDGSWHFMYNSGAVQFPLTNTISNLVSTYSAGTAASVSQSGDQSHAAQTVVIKASFKFRDPNQQGTSGSGTDIQEVKIINDLRVRISQTASPSSAIYPNGSYQSKTVHPLWGVKSINIQKGFGVTAPHVPQGGGDPIFTSVEQFETVTTGTNVAGVDPVPPVTVPAWTQVYHNYFLADSWVLDQNALGTGSGGNLTFLRAHQVDVFGNNYNYVLQTGFGQNANIAAAPNVNIEYYVPEDWAGLASPGSPPTNGSPYGTSGDSYQIAGVGQHGYNFNRVTAGNNNIPTPTIANNGLVEYDNEFVYIKNDTSTSATDIEYDISNDPWTAGRWYLVDVEFDESQNTVIGDPSEYGTGNNPAGGQLRVWGVLPNSPVDYSYNEPISNSSAYDHAYVGNFSGGHYAMLVPVQRTEYGTQRTVLRAIFKITNDSKVLDSSQSNYSATWKDKMTLRFLGVTSPGIQVQKIITKKLNGSTFNNWLNTNGKATNWTIKSGDSNSHEVVHAFQKKHIYFKNGKFNWHVPADFPGNLQYGHLISQDFNTAETQDAPTISTEGWELSFTVSNNTTTNNFSGNLRGWVAISDANAANGHEGLYFENIEETGNYLIKFNFDGDTTNWEILRGDLGLVPTATYSNGNILATSSIGNWTNTSSYADKIAFAEMHSQSGTPQEYAVSDIQLTDSRKVFLGGSSGSWSFRGFNTSENNYIYWDIDQLNLVFLNCPARDYQNNTLRIINANQQVDATIKQFEKYKIKFTHSISAASTASLFIYYYNTDGHGFKIENINSSTGIANGTQDIDGNPKLDFETIVTIGELDSSNNPVSGSFWSNINPIDDALEPDLKNSFVIAVRGPVNTIVDGTIDNIEMYRVYDDSSFSPTTITFNETVNGWTSFKSFTPESGVSVSKKYFTFDNGCLYQHYVPKLNGLIHDGDVKQADNYNEFYGTSYDSSITAVLNQEPSIVKTFNTLNYEGSQAQILQPGFGQEITAHNSEAFLNGDISGWECQEIKTDLESGSVNEFVKKEGKWFNYIKGITTTNINTSKFNIQGVDQIQSAVILDENASLSSIGNNNNADINGGNGGAVTVSSGASGNIGGNGGSGASGGGSGGGGGGY